MPRLGWPVAACLVLCAVVALWLGMRGDPGEGDDAKRADPGAPQAPSFRADGQDTDPSTAPPAATLEGHPALPGGRADPRRLVRGLAFDLATRRPLSGVTVTLRRGVETATAVTDERGVYALALPPAVEWFAWLTFERDGYVARGIDEGIQRRVSPQRRLAPVGLHPVRAELPGRVLDWRGRPLADARVRFHRAGTWYRADARGHFGPVPVGGRQVQWEAWAPDGALTDDTVDLDDGLPEVLTIRLVPHGYVEGQVVDVEGGPIPGARVHGRGRPDERRLRADAEGRFRWPQGFDRGVRLVAVAEGAAGMQWARAGIRTRIVVDPMEPGAWRWAFGPRYAPPPPPGKGPKPGPLVQLTLALQDEDGASLPWADVEWSWWNLPGREIEWADADGICRLELPSEVPLTFAFDHYACHGRKRTITLESGDDQVLTIELPSRPRAPSRSPEPEPEPPSWPTLTGVVIGADGLPRSGVTIEAPPWGNSSTDDWGRWSLEDENGHGDVRLRIDADGYGPVEARARFGGPAIRTVLPARGVIRVRLDGEPEPHVKPRVTLYAGTHFDDDLLHYQDELVLAEGDGYRIDCPVGVWTLGFELAPGALVHYPEVPVNAGEETLLRYPFPTFGTLELLVEDEQGKPIDDAYVSVATTDEGLGSTDEAGRFLEDELDAEERLPAGPVRLRVEADGYAPTFTPPLDLREDVRFRLRLDSGVLVRGVLRDGGGKPVVAHVAWVAPDGRLIYHVESEDDGTFELNGWLPPGPATLVVLGEHVEQARHTLQVPRDGKAVHVEIRIP